MGQKHYNLPIVSEIAILLPNYDEWPQGIWDIVLQLRGKGNNLECINECHLVVACMLLFPHGKLGWHIDLRHSNDQNNLIQKEYFAFWLFS